MSDWPLKCERCGRPCPYDAWVTGEGDHQSGWFASSATDDQGYPTVLVCPGCTTVAEDMDATAEVLGLLGDKAAPRLVDAEIERVVARQRWANGEVERGTKDE